MVLLFLFAFMLYTVWDTEAAVSVWILLVEGRSTEFAN